MAKKITWTTKASISFNSIIQYLEQKWGPAVTRKFVRDSFSIIQILSENPHLGSLEVPEKNIRGFLLSKHNRMFYRFTTNEFIILNIFDTRSNKSKI